MQHQQHLIGRRGDSLLTRLHDGLKINLSPFCRNLQIPQRGKLALFEYGVAQLARFEHAEARLRDYVEDATPS